MHKSRQLDIALLIIAVVLVIGGVVLWKHLNSSKVDTYSEDNCPKNQDIKAHTILLIDQTDPFTDSFWENASNIASMLSSERRNALDRYELLSVMPLTDNVMDSLQVVFQKCNPGREEQLDELFETRSHGQKKYDQTFLSPLQDSISSLRPTQNMPYSLIIETLNMISKIDSFSSSVPKRRLVIVSDMIQNSPAYSQLTRCPLAPLDEEIRRLKDAYSDLIADTNLDGVEVYVWIVEPPQDQCKINQGNPVHKKVWEYFFEACGAKKFEYMTKTAY